MIVSIFNYHTTIMQLMISAYHFIYIIDSMTFVLSIDQLLHFLVDILLSLFLAGNQYLCPRH